MATLDDPTGVAPATDQALSPTTPGVSQDSEPLGATVGCTAVGPAGACCCGHDDDAAAGAAGAGVAGTALRPQRPAPRLRPRLPAEEMSWGANKAASAQAEMHEPRAIAGRAAKRRAARVGRLGRVDRQAASQHASQGARSRRTARRRTRRGTRGNAAARLRRGIGGVIQPPALYRG